MPKNETKSERKIGLVIWRNVIAAVVILSLIVARQAILQSSISDGLDMSHFINVSGRQRMLSQKITKNSFVLSLADSERYPGVKDELKQDLMTWEDAYLYLSSDYEEDEHSFHFSEQMTLEWRENYTYQTSIRDAVLTIISLHDSGSPESDYFPYLDQISQAEKDYLSGMENIILLIETEGQSRNNEIHRLELILFYILVTSVFIQIFLVFLPGQRDLYKNFEKVQYLGDHDRLTGLLNQFAFNQKIEEDLQTSHMDHPLFLILFDIDGFTKIKDKHGLLISDDVLRRTAETLLASLKSSDYAARLTSDEYAIILHAAEKAEVESYTNSLLSKITSTEIPVVGMISACMGISKYHNPEPLISWLDRAQTALRQGKREGKNRIICETSIKEEVVGIVKWRDEWKSGNDEIDQQHEKLIQLGNDLIQSSLPDGDKALEGDLLKRISTDLINHFIYEEKLLRGIEYPETSEHAIIHDALIKKLQELITSYEKQQLNAGYVFSFIVDEVILGHIEKEDTKYFPYFKK